MYVAFEVAQYKSNQIIFNFKNNKAQAESLYNVSLGICTQATTNESDGIVRASVCP